jgi:cytochrome oxidase Cu insertion factor (SCO1/SenC/PrrC family)
MHKVRFVSYVLMVLAAAGAGRAADKAPVGKTGLKVGTKAPPFMLKDQNGKERALDEFLMKGNVALVFHRSARW